MKEYLINNIDSIIAYLFGASGFIKAWTEHKKRKADILSGIQKNYEQFVEHYNEKFDELNTELSNTKIKIDEIEAYWKKRYNALKREFDNYKKNHT